jgi:hypothetical protein
VIEAGFRRRKRLTLSAVVTRMKQIAQGIGRELRGGFSLTADPRSFARFAADVFLLRLARIVPLPGRNRERRIRVRGGIELNYRLNRGDMQSIREVWMDECYRLPFELAPGRLIDLGANMVSPVCGSRTATAARR